VSAVRNERTGKLGFFFRVVEVNDGVAGKKVSEIDGDRLSGAYWTPDSESIVVRRDIGYRNLFKLDITTKQETPVRDLDADMENGGCLWSQDGTKILFFRSSELSGLVRINDMGLAD
jgi:Tol biopolymer transport system component